MGDASSLKGGVLDSNSVARGGSASLRGGAGPLLTGYSGTGVIETVARAPNGAMIERDMGQEFASRKMFRLTLHNPDFTTAARTSKVINKELSGKYASALDAGTIDVISPPPYEGKGVELLALDRKPGHQSGSTGSSRGQ